MNRPFVLGITGMPGSGKTQLCKKFQSIGVLIILADELGHQVLKKKDIKRVLKKEFGDDIEVAGQIDRKLLGNRVFNNQKTNVLNKITHPAIKDMFFDILINDCNQSSYVVFEAAILFEAGFDDLCDLSITVDTPFDIRLERVKKFRSWQERELKSRDSCQNEYLKRSKSDLSLDGSKTIESFKTSVQFVNDAILSWLSFSNRLEDKKANNIINYLKKYEFPEGIRLNKI